jgi:hypothetical protein
VRCDVVVFQRDSRLNYPENDQFQVHLVSQADSREDNRSHADTMTQWSRMNLDVEEQASRIPKSPSPISWRNSGSRFRGGRIDREGIRISTSVT